jgi:hypothetical protein
MHQLYTDDQLRAMTLNHFALHFEGVDEYCEKTSLPAQFRSPASEADLVLVAAGRDLRPLIPGGGFATGIVFLSLVRGGRPLEKYVPIPSQEFDGYADRILDTIEFQGSLYLVKSWQTSFETNLFEPYPLLAELYRHLEQGLRTLPG